LGPTNWPIIDTAFPEILFWVTSEPVTKAVNVPRPVDSTYTVCPFKNDRTPVKFDNRNPSLIVGSGPIYVKVAVPYTRETPVISRVVA
jgi:hypothetical protein